MGLINHSVLPYNGINLTDSYICISSNTIRMRLDKEITPNVYSIQIDYAIYASQDAKNNGFPPLLNMSLIETLDTLPADMYAYGYQQLKIMYPVYSDV